MQKTLFRELDVLLHKTHTVHIQENDVCVIDLTETPEFKDIIFVYGFSITIKNGVRILFYTINNDDKKYHDIDSELFYTFLKIPN